MKMKVGAFVLGAVIAVITAAVPLRAQVADSAAEYYPLAVGNVWQYVYRPVTQASGGIPYTIEVVGDTIMPNGRLYYHIVELPWGLYAPRYPVGVLGYARYDSASGSIRYYDTGMSADQDAWVSLRAWADSSTIGTAARWVGVVLGDSVGIVSKLIPGGRKESYARGIGPVGGDFGDCENDFISQCERHEIIYARIGGTEYGQFLSAPASEREPAIALDACTPNPFVVSTAIGYTLPKRSHVRLDVVDEAGREVATLVDGYRDAGGHSSTLDGAGLANGLYVVRLRAGGATLSRTIVLAR